MTFYQDIKTLFTDAFQIAFELVALVTATPIYMLILGAVAVASFWLGGFIAGIVCLAVIIIWFLASIHIRATKQALIPGMVIWTFLALLAFGYLGGYRFGYLGAYPKVKELIYGKELAKTGDEARSAEQKEQARQMRKKIASSQIEYIKRGTLVYLNCSSGSCAGKYEPDYPSSDSYLPVAVLNSQTTINGLVLEKILVAKVLPDGRIDMVNGTEAFVSSPDLVQKIQVSNEKLQKTKQQERLEEIAAKERERLEAVEREKSSILTLNGSETSSGKYVFHVPEDGRYKIIEPEIVKGGGSMIVGNRENGYTQILVSRDALKLRGCNFSASKGDTISFAASRSGGVWKLVLKKM